MPAVSNVRSFMQREVTGPLILLFSTRERIRDILTIGLMQCNYQVIRADSSYLAMIKINQFLPGLVIIDVTADNVRDLILIQRLQHSIRTRRIPVLIILPDAIRPMLDKEIADCKKDSCPGESSAICSLQYPFHFADLLKAVKPLVAKREGEVDAASSPETSSAARNELLSKQLFDTGITVETKLRQIEQSMHKQWAFPFTVIS